MLLKIYNRHPTSIKIDNTVIKPKTSEIIETNITDHIRQLERNNSITYFEVSSDSKSKEIEIPNSFGESTTTHRKRRKSSSENNVTEQNKE